MKAYKAIAISVLIVSISIYFYYMRCNDRELLNSDNEYRQDYLEERINDLDGLVAYYPLNEISGDAVNRASATYGTLNGIVNGATQGAEGLIGNAYSFDGIDDEIIIDYDPAIDITGDEISLFALVKLSSLPSTTNNQMQIIKHLRTSPTSGGYQLEVNGTDSNYPNEIRINVKGPDDNYLSGQGKSLEIGSWYFIVATFDGESLKTYINGVIDKMDDASGELLANSQNLVIGGQCNSQNNFHGLIQHIGVVNRCLNEEEVTNLTNVIWEKTE